MKILKRIQILAFALFPIALISAMAQQAEKPVNGGSHASSAWTLVLNGTSSAGKSTLAKNFKDLAPQQRIEILQFDTEATQVIKETLETMGHHYDGKTDIWTWFDTLPEEIKKKIDKGEGSWGEQSYKRLIAKAQTSVAKGINVIIDTVFSDETSYTRFKTELSPERTYFVLVYAPILQLLTNVLARNSSGNKSEERDLSMPFGQYLQEFYQPCDSSSPNKLDVLTREDFDVVFQELERCSKDQDQDNLKDGKAKVISTFFGDKEATGIALKMSPHDFVIHTENANSYDCAQTLAAWLASKVQ